jgi:predicted nucleic acid-binding protein
VSYLTAKPSRDVYVRVHQETTRRWWRTRRKKFQLFVSPLVLEEAAAGDQVAARRRTRLLGRLPQVAITDSVSRIAETLVQHGAIPRVAEVDAVHVALAAVHGLDYLLTWNCKHIANATKRVEIEELCREEGFEPPVICTPEELMED